VEVEKGQKGSLESMSSRRTNLSPDWVVLLI
jgi:hypothetical protein